MVVPYKNEPEGKKEQVARMFDSISGRYDRLNHLLSMGIDRIWRRKAIKLLSAHQPKSILDIATGTADFAIEAGSIPEATIIGVDISEGMLDQGRKKILKLGLKDRITLKHGDSENLPFENNSFDSAIVAFGVRNFENLDKGLKDIFRVLKPGGKFIILEISEPHQTPWKQIFSVYFHHVLPFAGKIISKDKHAYSYLPESVVAFPKGLQFTQRMEAAGFHKCEWRPLTLGICALYIGEK